MSSFLKKVWGTSSASGDSKRKGNNNITNSTIESLENLELKEQQLEKRRELVEQKMNAEFEKAKAFMKQNKRSQAAMCMKKKKMHEKNMEDLGNLIMRVNEQRILLENAQTTAETLKALESATKASKNVLKDNKISDVEKIMDDIASETDTMREVQDRLAEPVGFMADFDDDDLLAELEGENLDDELLQPNKVPEYNAGRIEASIDQELPSVPTTTLPNPKEKAKTDEEKELEELAAELA